MPATIGDNSRDLTPGEAKALYMHHFGAIQKQTAICAAENETRKQLRKLAKADGIILSDIDFGLRCATIEDPMVIVAEQRRRAEIGRFFALPIGAQGDLDFEREPGVERAAREGEAAGFLAKDADSCPYDESSPMGRAWLDAWTAAQKQMLADFESGMKKKQAEAEAAKAAASGADDGANDPE